VTPLFRRLAAEPFYGADKRRLRELLRARPGGRYLDVGAGTGDSALGLHAETGAWAVGADSSLTMAIARAASRSGIISARREGATCASAARSAVN
jgi:hypothetical protein